MKAVDRKVVALAAIGLLVMVFFVYELAFSPPSQTTVASAFEPSGVRPPGCTETVRLTLRPGEAVRCNQGTMVQVTRSYWLRNDYLNQVDVTCTCPSR